LASPEITETTIDVADTTEAEEIVDVAATTTEVAIEAATTGARVVILATGDKDMTTVTIKTTSNNITRIIEITHGNAVVVPQLGQETTTTETITEVIGEAETVAEIEDGIRTADRKKIINKDNNNSNVRTEITGIENG
jgi:hypothetical protein